MVSERSHELIQKYLEALATEAELAELESLLADDPGVADAFADAARLHANLQQFFQQQYKIDQVATLLASPESTAAAAPSSGPTGAPGAPVVSPLPPDSSFVPIYSRLETARRSRHATRPERFEHRWRSLTAVLLVVSMGVAVWSLRSPEDQRPRLISGRLAVAGRVVADVPATQMFEVEGKEAAVIELPGGAQLALAAGTRVTLHRDGKQSVVELESGSGEFRVPSAHPDVVVTTPLGIVTTTGGRFTVEFVKELPERLAPTVPIRLPQLSVTVALGSVTVDHAGMKTRISTGEMRLFFDPA